MGTRLKRVRDLFLLAFTVAVAACGGTVPVEGDPTTSGGSESSNDHLVIEVRSSVSVVVGRSLTVDAEVVGTAPGSVTYSVSNGPGWLSISPDTGELTGTPTASDIGTYERIRITASDGKSEASAFITINVTMTAAGRATVSWRAPTERTDGSPLTDLAGFRIYYGESRSSLQYVIEVADPVAGNWVVTDLTPGTWYFAATAYDASGAESSLSNVASKVIA
jgi:hypothetical protein